MINILITIFTLLSISIHGTNVTVSTFNVNALIPIINSSRVKLICENIKKSSADVILLQEVWLKSYRSILKNCGYKYNLDMNKKMGLFKRVSSGIINNKTLKSLSWFLSSFIPNDYGYDTGLMILSKHPFNKTREPKRLEFKQNGDENYYFDGEIVVNKGAIGTFITINNKRLFIVDTHLVANYSDSRYSKQRIEQLKELKQWVLEQSKGESFIVGGDFNFSTNKAQDTSIWNKIITEVWPSSIFKEVSNVFIKKTHGEGILDRIFGSSELTPIMGSLVFNRSLEPLSDHYGFQAIFKVK